MYVKEHPRLINEIPRGSKRYDTFKKMRPASERSNSTMKEDLKILDKPRVLNAQRANILAQMAAIVSFSFSNEPSLLLLGPLTNSESFTNPKIPPLKKSSNLLSYLNPSATLSNWSNSLIPSNNLQLFPLR